MEDPWPRSGGAQGWWTAALPLPLGVTGDSCREGSHTLSLPLPSEELLAGWGRTCCPVRGCAGPQQVRVFGSLGAETSEGFVEEVALELVVKTGRL